MYTYIHRQQQTSCQANGGGGGLLVSPQYDRGVQQGQENQTGEGDRLLVV